MDITSPQYTRENCVWTMIEKVDFLGFINLLDFFGWTFSKPKFYAIPMAWLGLPTFWLSQSLQLNLYKTAKSAFKIGHNVLKMSELWCTLLVFKGRQYPFFKNIIPPNSFHWSLSCLVLLTNRSWLVLWQ